jgi:hypothetical protein
MLNGKAPHKPLQSNSDINNSITMYSWQLSLDKCTGSIFYMFCILYCKWYLSHITYTHFLYCMYPWGSRSIWLLFIQPHTIITMDTIHVLEPQRWFCVHMHGACTRQLPPERLERGDMASADFCRICILSCR